MDTHSVVLAILVHYITATAEVLQCIKPSKLLGHSDFMPAIAVTIVYFNTAVAGHLLHFGQQLLGHLATAGDC
jgi:hypothetical protein